MLPPGYSGPRAEQLHDLIDRLESLPVVNPPAVFDTNWNNKTGALRVNLWCRGQHTKAADKQPLVALNKKPSTDAAAVPDYIMAAEKLIHKVEDGHVGCVFWTSKLRSKVVPGKFGYVQADKLWSESERKHLRPGHGCVWGRDQSVIMALAVVGLEPLRSLLLFDGSLEC